MPECGSCGHEVANSAVRLHGGTGAHGGHEWRGERFELDGDAV